MKCPWIIYGTAWKKERTAELVQLAVKSGFRAIDTANQPKHYNEPGVGEACKILKKAGIEREALFLQTKFTPRDGQDHRVPYDESSELRDQVLQSFESSLDHLETDYIDSFLLHGPYNHPGLGDEDWEVWGAIEELKRSGRVCQIGVSNVNHIQLEELMSRSTLKPDAVQNRCYASRLWDKQVREICQANGTAYQGFSLLTANPSVIAHPKVLATASRMNASAEQVIFSFSRQIGITALTGTTDRRHMQEDLAAEGLSLTSDELKSIEAIA